MSKNRIINMLVAVAILAALSVNAASECQGWALVGDITGWTLIVGILSLVIDNKIKDGEHEHN